MRGHFLLYKPFQSAFTVLALLIISSASFSQDFTSIYAEASDAWGKDWRTVVRHLEKAEQLLKHDQGIYHPNYLTLLNELGIAYFESGQISEARKSFIQLCNLYDRLDNSGNHAHWLAYANKARIENLIDPVIAAESFSYLLDSPFEDIRISGLNGMYDLNIQHGDFTAAENLMNNFQPQQPAEDIAKSLLEIDLHRNKGNLELAEDLIIAFDSIAVTLDPSLSQTAKLGLLEQKGFYYLEKGDFQHAETTFRELLAFQDYLGLSESEKSITHNSLARLYEFHGLFDMAVAEIDSAFTGCVHGCETLLQNKAAIFLRMGEISSARDILEQIRREYSFKSPKDELAFHLNFLSSQRDVRNDTGNSLSRAMEIMEHDSAAIPIMLQASFYQVKGIAELNVGNYSHASRSFLSSFELQREIVGAESFKLREIQNYLGITYLLEGKRQESIRMLQKATKAEKDFVKFVYPVLTRAEQMSFITKLREDMHLIYSAVVNEAASDQDLLAMMLQRQMIYKGLTLNVKRRAERLSDESSVELKELKSEYYSIRKQLAEGYVRMYLNNEVTSITALEGRIASLEMQINRLSGEQNVSETLPEATELARHLNEGEMLIEFIRLNRAALTAAEKESINYLALTLRPDGRLELAVLENGEFLEERQIKYYLNSVKFDQPDSLSYGEFWEPIMDIAPETTTAFVVLDGLYHKLNPATLWISGDKEFLGERMDLTILQNSSQLMNRDVYNGEYSASRTATLIGDPVLEEDGPFVNLPGTKTEIENIRNVLTGNGWKTLTFTGKEATKKNVHQINNQGVLHFATHGYFSEKQMIGREKLPDIELFRSGLILSAEQSAKGDLFSAFEVSDLNLAGTELVVLSACESGLGDLQNGDGVYGLQYGFFVAGAKTVVLSLWQVDDKVTQEYMEVFYSQLLKTSNKRQAYNETVRVIREKYPSPRFWGAFIYLGD